MQHHLKQENIQITLGKMTLSEDKSILIEVNQKIPKGKYDNITGSTKSITIYSEAFPESSSQPNEEQKINIQQQSTANKQMNIRPIVRSQVHQKLKQINFTLESHEQPVIIRQFKMTDLPQLKKLQDEWFPIKYGDAFYKKIVQKQVYCLVAETSIKIKETDDQQIDQQRNEHSQEKQSKILVGAVVFQVTDSQGYAQKSLFRTFLNLFSHSEDSIYIMTLGVIDQFRKKGVGKLLVESIIQNAKRIQTVKLIYLHVISYNKAAIHFYKKIGFQNLQTLDNFYHVANKTYGGQVYGIFVNDGKLNSGWNRWISKWLK